MNKQDKKMEAVALTLDHIQSKDSNYMRPFLYSVAFIKMLDILLMFGKEKVENGANNAVETKSIKDVDFIIIDKNELYNSFKIIYKSISGQELVGDVKQTLEEIFADFLINIKNPNNDNDENDYYISRALIEDLVNIMREVTKLYQ